MLFPPAPPSYERHAAAAPRAEGKLALLSWILASPLDDSVSCHPLPIVSEFGLLKSSQNAAPAQTPQPGIGAWAQPVAGLQESEVQASPSLQVIGELPTQEPPLHALTVVQALPSSQGVPSALGGVFSQIPVAGLQVFAS